MRIGIHGARGRMGRALVRAVVDEPRATLAAAVDRPGEAADAGTLAGLPPLGLGITDNVEALGGCEVVIDFTLPGPSAALAGTLADTGVALVIGTTGYGAAEEATVADAARRIAVVKSGNMSLGVNVLAAMVRRAAAALPAADIEIVEMHHRRKVDAPSGTALLLGEAAAAGRGIDLRDHAVMAREGHTGERAAGTIGFQSLRGGTVVGEHQVILALDGERIVLGHTAEDRGLFARGAVVAALWTRGRPPGLYGMADVLGLHDA